MYAQTQLPCLMRFLCLSGPASRRLFLATSSRGTCRLSITCGLQFFLAQTLCLRLPPYLPYLIPTKLIHSTKIHYHDSTVAFLLSFFPDPSCPPNIHGPRTIIRACPSSDLTFQFLLLPTTPPSTLPFTIPCYLTFRCAHRTSRSFEIVLDARLVIVIHLRQLRMTLQNPALYF